MTTLKHEQYLEVSRGCRGSRARPAVVHDQETWVVDREMVGRTSHLAGECGSRVRG
jgi:hypothetical protein